MGRGPVALRRPGLTLLLTAALTLAADQATKAAARTYLATTPSTPIVPGVFELSYVRNTGAAFGIMAGWRPVFVVVTLLVLAGVGYVWFRYRPRSPLVVIVLGLVCGGALGNLIDRLVAGKVTDFLHFHYRGVFDFPVFNVADSAIVVGVAILVVWVLMHPDEPDDDETGGHEDAGAGED
jgi:signal peptidase II